MMMIVYHPPLQRCFRVLALSSAMLAHQSISTMMIVSLIGSNKSCRHIVRASIYLRNGRTTAQRCEVNAGVACRTSTWFDGIIGLCYDASRLTREWGFYQWQVGDANDSYSSDCTV
ncbi:uncharacterized protein BO66DRAFT_176310 [Aspergillus aculeatinus CBS 121060]|uniref:Uncharacterized protein n=1 Tax=Aspergillus aculeatinus CBS 121060 TaxID=1448322 RepID=A0ACD1HJE8_9EURO|nr:hypothetical protein BO66DRAFT_176310 [Aspergillus aculeatinus CBS 121060]RAH73928.1 hypothetical protein BO66DRAFT_176310 [Aspergillus aculeatinus CBS 121060]